MSQSPNKAILIVDAPVSNNGECPCRNCLLHVVEYDDYYHHYICQSETTSVPDEWEIYKKCPLKIPTVDAEPVRHAHWEKPHRHGVVTYDERAYAECSCCHKPEYLARGMNYCPNCGAKMDEEKENEMR